LIFLALKNYPTERRSMIKKLLLLALFTTLLIFATNLYAESDEICCSWVNTNYTSGDPPQKLNFHFDGTFACYNTQKTSEALKWGTYYVAEKWQDSEGNTWYKIKMSDPRSPPKYMLARISGEGKVLEFMCKPDKYPTDISSKDRSYCKYERF
jgi:hypothetical protein